MADANDTTELKKTRRKQQNREAAQRSYRKKKTENDELQRSISQKEEDQIQLHRQIGQAQAVLASLKATTKRIVCVPSHRGPQLPSTSGTEAAFRSDAPACHHVRPPPHQLASPAPLDPGTAFPRRSPDPRLQAAAAGRRVPATASQGQQNAMKGYDASFSNQQPGACAALASAASVMFPQQQPVPSSCRSYRGVRDHDNAASLANVAGNHEGFAAPQPGIAFSGFALDSSTEQAGKWEYHSQQLGTQLLGLSGPTLDHQPMNHVGHASVNFLYTPVVNQESEESVNSVSMPTVDLINQGPVKFFSTPEHDQTSHEPVHLLSSSTANHHTSHGLVNSVSMSTVDLINQEPVNFFSTPEHDQTSHEPVHLLSSPTANHHTSHGLVNFPSTPTVNDVGHGSMNLNQTTVDCSILDLVTFLESPDMVSYVMVTEHEGSSVLGAAPLTGRTRQSFQENVTTTPNGQSELVPKAFVRPGSSDAREIVNLNPTKQRL